MEGEGERMTISRDELVELFKEAPKESFELLLRNLRIRESSSASTPSTWRE